VGSKTFHLKCYFKIKRWVFEILFENEDKSKCECSNRIDSSFFLNTLILIGSEGADKVKD